MSAEGLSLGTVIAARDLIVRDENGERPVNVTIGAPQPLADGQDWYCPFRIDRLEEGPLSSYACGVDAVQALLLALSKIGAVLYTSADAKTGRLQWLEADGDLGFPVPESVTDLLPPSARSKYR